MLARMDAALLSLPLETLQAYLAEAIAAVHTLATGRRVTLTQMDRSQGRKSEYAPVDMAELKAYVADLQGAIAAKQSGAAAVRRPIYLIPGR